MQTQTVVVEHVVTTEDDLGNSTTARTTQTVARCLFEPQQAVERTDPRSPGVVTPAKFYLPIPLQLDADDTITDEASVVWQVIGGSAVWIDQTEVPVKRAGSV